MSWSEAKVVRRKVWDEAVWSMTLAAEDISPHKPGQWTNLALDVAGERIRRPYSIASAPGAPLEFLLVEVADGALSPKLHALDEGQSVWVEQQAHGFFTLDEVPDCHTLWMLATGTGLGPFMAMLRSNAAARFPQIVLAHGVRHADQLAYREELEAMAGVSYVPLVTREDALGSLRARIPAAIEDGQLERHAGLRIDEDSHLMLCGNPEMVKEATSTLKARGLNKHRRRKPGHITTEAYW